MNKKRKKVILGLMGLYCLGSSSQVDAAPVTTAAELAATGGVVTVDTTSAMVGEAAMGIWNTGASGDFIYTASDVQINIVGYDLLQVPNLERTGIRSTGSDLTLGKTTLIWRNDSTNTASNFNIYGIKTYNSSTVTLGDESWIDIEGNTSDRLIGVYAGNNAATGPGSVVLGNETSVLVKNNGDGIAYGIQSVDGATTTVGDDLYVKASNGTGGARGLEVGLNQASLAIGSDATVVVDTTGRAQGLFAYDGVFTAQENLNVFVNSTAAGDQQSLGLSAQTNAEVYLNGATVVASQNGVAGVGHSIIASSGSTIQGNLGKYSLVGHMIAADASIAIDFDKTSYFEGASRVGGTGTIDYRMDGTTWKMTDNSKVTSLALHGDSSNVIFAGDSNFKTLTISDLVGTDGHFAMRSDIVGNGTGNSTGDLLVVTGNSVGEHTVTVQNRGSANSTGTETLTIIDTADGTAEFKLTQATEVGGYEYELRRTNADSSNWELYGARRSTSTGSASINSFGAGYLLGYAETQTLLQRMGDLRQSEVTGEPTGNIWARAFGGKFTSSSDGFLSGFDMTYSGLQIGADKKRKWGNADVYLGAMFGVAHSNQDFATGKGSISDRHVGLYGVYIQPSGFYVDSLVKYTKMEHDFKVLDTAGTRVTGDDMSTDGLSASIEVGQRIHLDRKSKEGWYLEPQAQISTGHQSGGSFNASNGLRVDVDSYNSTLGRLGLNAGYEIKSGKNPVNIYAKASYVHEFDGDVAYRFNGSREQTSFGDSWWTYGLGITAQINKKHNVYLDVERASGGQFNQPWSVNGGYRFNW